MNTAVQQERTIEIAKTIMSQIKVIDYWALGSYGANMYAAMSEDETRIGGLTFKVNGFNHRGWVKVELTWSDEYRVHFINRNRVLVRSIDGVFCDELVTVLDWIEKGDEVEF